MDLSMLLHIVFSKSKIVIVVDSNSNMGYFISTYRTNKKILYHLE